jgi:hypothetical protein
MSKTVIIQAQQKWDYRCESRRTENSMLATLNELGQSGWELVNIVFHKDMKGEIAWTAFLKRPSVAQTPTPAAGQSSATLATPAPSAPPKPSAEKSGSLQGFDLSGDEFQLKTE